MKQSLAPIVVISFGIIAPKNCKTEQQMLFETDLNIVFCSSSNYEHSRNTISWQKYI